MERMGTMNQKEFMETMEALLDLAVSKENCLLKEEVEEAFSQMKLEENQLEMIWKYLEENGVSISGREAVRKEKKVEEPEEARRFLEYEKSLLSIKRLTEKELEEAVSMLSFPEQAVQAKRLLANHFLPETVRLAREYGDRGVNRMDLVQEGSLALLEAMEEYEGGPLESYFEKRLREAMELFIKEQEEQMLLGENLSKRANRLSDISGELSEELGRVPTVSELSEKMGLPEEEIREIIKISMDAMSVPGAGENGESSFEESSEKADFS